MPVTDILRSQYAFTTSSRAVLFEYCSTITPGHFVSEVDGFGRGGSMRNLLVHIGTTYQYWIGKFSLSRDIRFAEIHEYSTIADVAGLFEKIDQLMNEFFEKFDGRLNEALNDSTPLKVFTHVITHEFHHKGQIVSVSRHLGYTPVDTDVMR